MDSDIEQQTLQSFVLPSGRLSEAVTDLISASSIREWVSMSSSSSWKGTSFTVTGLSVDNWSTGERILWQFLLSLASGGPLNLQQLTDYFRHTDLSVLIYEILCEALNVQRERAVR